MNRVEKLAYETISDGKIDKLPVNAKQIAKQNGYRVLTYDRAAALIKKLNLTEYAETHDGFSLKHSGQFYILLSDRLTKENEYLVIGHEIGHIKQHYTADDCVIGGSKQQELEADEFARYLLAPIPVLHNLNINDVEDIRNYTGLSLKDAKLVLDDLLSYSDDYCSLITQKEIERNFFRFSRKENSREKREMLFYKAVSPVISSIIIVALVVYIIVQGSNNHQQLTDTSSSDTYSDVDRSVISVSESQTSILPSEDNQTVSAHFTAVSDTYTQSENNTNNISVYTAPSTAPIRNTNLPIDATYYWTDSGEVFHYYADCQSLKNVIEVNSGSLAAAEKEKDRLCKFCEGRMREDG